MTPTEPVAGGGENQNVLSYQNQFQIAYIKSKPPAWGPLYNNMLGGPNAPQLTYPARVALLQSLFQSGAKLDPFIEGGNGNIDPLTIHTVREHEGWAWVASGTGLDASSDVMGIGNSLPCPPNGIPTSTNINDYPPYPVPIVPVVPPNTVLAPNPVGVREPFNNPATGVGDYFRPSVANDGYPTDGTGQWTGSAAGLTGTWTKEALEAGLMTVWVKTA